MDPNSGGVQVNRAVGDDARHSASHTSASFRDGSPSSSTEQVV